MPLPMLRTEIPWKKNVFNKLTIPPDEMLCSVVEMEGENVLTP